MEKNVILFNAPFNNDDSMFKLIQYLTYQNWRHTWSEYTYSVQDGTFLIWELQFFHLLCKMHDLAHHSWKPSQVRILDVVYFSWHYFTDKFLLLLVEEASGCEYKVFHKCTYNRDLIKNDRARERQEKIINLYINTQQIIHVFIDLRHSVAFDVYLALLYSHTEKRSHMWCDQPHRVLILPTSIHIFKATLLMQCWYIYKAIKFPTIKPFTFHKRCLIFTTKLQKSW